MKVVIAVSLVSAVLGTIHAFSVFIDPLEASFAASRSAVSLTYSLALVSLTSAVLVGPRLFGRWSAAAFIAGACAFAALGAVVAALAPSLPMVWLGYSLIFGAANGLGYGFGLQLAAQVSPGREGFAMGVVTAAYALGAALSPALFEGAGGFTNAMLGLAAALAVAGAVSAIMLRGVRFAPGSAAGGAQAPAQEQILLWLGYFGAVLAGLMVIGHAAEIARSFAAPAPAWVAPMLIAIANLGGSIACGRAADHVPGGRILIALAAATAATAFALASLGGAVLVALALVGFCYGGAIAVFPAVIAKRYGMAASARVYGRVFTAWGAAGLAGPWLAGALFDRSGDYDAALFTAAAVGLAGAAAFSLLFARPRL